MSFTSLTLPLFCACLYFLLLSFWCRCDRMVVESTTTYAISASNVVSLKPAHGRFYSIQHYVKKFDSNLRQVGCFLLVLWFPPPIKLTMTI